MSEALEQPGGHDVQPGLPCAQSDEADTAAATVADPTPDPTRIVTSDVVDPSEIDPVTGEVSPAHMPLAPMAAEPFIPTTRLRKLTGLFGRSQFVRYLCVGVINTLWGYSLFVITLALISRAAPTRFLYLEAPAASIISTPFNITLAYFLYKFIVFRTRGNYLREWLKCFAVYGAGQIPGLLALGALTKYFQTMFHTHGAQMHGYALAVEQHLSGASLRFFQGLHGPAVAGYAAGAVVTAVATVYSFLGHKKVTFKA